MANDNQDRIESYVDRTGFANDTKFVLEQINTVYTAFLKLGEIKVGLGKVEGLTDTIKLTKEAAGEVEKITKANTALSESNKKVSDGLDKYNSAFRASSSSIQENIQKQVEYKQRLSEITGELKTLKAQQDLISKTPGNDDAKKQIKDRILALSEEQAQLKLLNQEVTKVTNNQIRGTQATTGTLKELRAELDRVRNIRDTELVIGSEDYKLAQERVLALNDAVKREEFGGGDFQRQVGNYHGAAKVIVDALKDVEAEIDNLKQKQAGLQDLTKRTVVEGFGKGNSPSVDPGTEAQLTAVNAQLGFAIQKSEALNNITSNPQFLNVAAKVGDTNKELKFFTQRLNELEDAGLKNSQVYKDIQGRLAQLTDQLGDTRAEIKALSSDTRSFDLFAGSVAFAADVFQTAAGAAVLFGASEKDAAEATKTLVAIQSVSNGLKGIAKELTDKETAAGKAYVAVQGLIKTATSATATAQQRLNAVLKLSGIGLLITGIGLLVANFSKLKDFLIGTSRESERFAEQQKRIAEFNKDVNASVAKESSELKILKSKIEDTKLPMEVRIANVKDLQALYPEYFKDLKQEDILNGNAALAYDAAAAAILRKAKALAANKRIEELSQKDLDIDEEAAKDKARTDKAIANATARFKIVRRDETELVKTRKEVQAELQDDFNKREALRAKERKALSDQQNFFLGTIKDNTDLTADQRKRNEDEEKKAADDRKKAADKANDAARKRIEDEKKAALELLKSRQQTIIDDNKAIADTDLFSNKTRIEALNKIAEAEKVILTAQSSFDLSQKDLTTSGKTKIEEEYANNILKINEDLSDKIFRLQIGSKNSLAADRARLLAEEEEMLKKRDEEQFARDQKQIDNLKKNLEEQLSVIQIGSDQQLTALNKQYSKGLISKEDFENEKKRIEAEAIRDSLKAQIDYYTKLLELQDAAGIDTTKAREELDKLNRELSGLNIEIEKTVPKFQKVAQEIEKFLAKVLAKGEKILPVVSGALDAAATIQKNRIEEEIKLLEEKAAKEIEFINQTSTNKEEAANRIQIIEARAAAQKAILERRQQQIDQRRAQFEKAANIAKIVIEGAMAVVHQLGSGDVYTAIPRAIVAGAFAAAQLAVAIATPIPKFKHGKTASNDYQGPAIVGDGGRAELIERKDGSFEVTPDKPTLTWVDKDDVIHRDAKQALKFPVQHNLDTYMQISRRQTDAVLAHGPVITTVLDLDPVTAGLKRMEKSIVSTIKNKTENHFHSESQLKLLMKKTGDGWTKYL